MKISGLLPLSIFTVVVLGAASTATCHDAGDPRHKAMTALGEHMKALGSVSKGHAPAGPAAARHADQIVKIGGDMAGLFERPSKHPKSREKPAIWSDKAGFARAIRSFQGAADALRLAVAGGQAARIAEALAAAGKSCKGCHEEFRTPKKK